MASSNCAGVRRSPVSRNCRVDGLQIVDGVLDALGLGTRIARQTLGIHRLQQQGLKLSLALGLALSLGLAFHLGLLAP